MKQGISDSDHAALIAGAYKFTKRELGLIDNTEMGALNPMSLAEVQNKTVSLEMLQELGATYNRLKISFYSWPDIDGSNVESDLQKKRIGTQLDDARSAYHAALRRYQEQTK